MNTKIVVIIALMFSFQCAWAVKPGDSTSTKVMKYIGQTTQTILADTL